MGSKGIKIRKKSKEAPKFKGGKRARMGKEARKRPKKVGEEGFKLRKSSGEVNYSHVKNKHKRQELVGALHRHKLAAKTEARRDKLAKKERGEEVEDGWTRTIEGTRLPDETIVPEGDEEIDFDENNDEFKTYFDGKREPKLMMTTQIKPSKKMKAFLKEMKFTLPNCHYFKRSNFKLKQIIEWGKNKDFTDLIVFTECKGKPHGMYIVHMPNGPTSYWRLTSPKLAQDMPGGASLNVDHEPEVIMKHFETRVGHRASRQLAALFPIKPEFHGRRVIVFHNQRDFVFFRHYRYQFKKNGTKAVLQEIGPRFTIKMRYMQHGTFDSKHGEYEWVWRPDSQVKRTAMAM